MSRNAISPLFSRSIPIGSQPPRIYGLAKVHKNNTPMRPVLSMPGSPYYKLANQVAKWLSVVDECNINSSTKQISDLITHLQLAENEELVSFDVTSLYTNVPLNEAIDDCTSLLYSGKYEKPPVDRETFHKLTLLCSSNVVMSTHDGYYQQVDGLAMGSPPAPMLANGWLSKFDDIIKGDADLFARYMDDIIRNINKDKIQEKLNEINNIHPSLKFTIERENNREIAFLDMSIKRTHGNLVSKWYTKPTDTGLTLNFHALAPKQYKRSVVSGLYRGKVSGNFKRTLNNIKAPCRIIFTLNKLKSCLPSLKPTVEKSLKSGVVYKFSCPRCSSCYVGQTSRHLICRFKEHRRNGPVADHWKECERELSIDDVTILCSNSKSTYHLMTLEALFINQLKPSLNTKDEQDSGRW
ncbi:uncharacterized protein LOC130637039 [Hydractinia symbiolongicarpus]|uniref:uncharacterized protein LOC130637039 n=1 Tax=Hydractinia symbiolongicarpus TaxID=13093 RepID=UPI00254AA8E8|nr:uncharacterized protein LOC130637039 [Hydractinia symbiolongicarpus]